MSPGTTMLSNTFTKSLLAFGLGLTLLPGCPLLDVEADAQEVCLTYPNLQVPAAGGLTSLHQSFSFDDLSQIHDLADLDADIELIRAEVHATSGISDFSFIHSAKIVVGANAQAGLPALTMYDCNGDCNPEGAKLVIPAAKVNDAIEYLRGDALTVDVSFEGVVPDKAWTMDVDVCMKASASYTFSP
jgi:hypothetical protein